MGRPPRSLISFSFPAFPEIANLRFSGPLSDPFQVREIQVEIAEAHPRGAWVNTDDLNDGMSAKGADVKDDLHYTPEGFKILGERFTNAAVDLINNRPKAINAIVLDRRLVEQIEAKLEAERRAKALRKAMEKSGEIERKKKKDKSVKLER